MLRIAFLVLWSVFAGALYAQRYPGFDAATLAKLNTAESAGYLTADEKEVVLMMNLARHDGPAFWQQIAAPYIRENGLKESKYTRSLEVDLNKTKGLAALKPERDLHEGAKKHALASGKSGAIGHDSSAGTFRQRMNALRPNYSLLSENCDYGSGKALDILMNLLIDEDIEDVGHRQNILDPNVNRVGVSIQPHKLYKVTSVQIFGFPK